MLLFFLFLSLIDKGTFDNPPFPNNLTATYIIVSILKLVRQDLLCNLSLQLSPWYNDKFELANRRGLEINF